MIKGKAWKYGDDVDTDVIIPAKYLTSSDPEVLKVHCLQGLDEGFAGKVAAGDIIVAGNNFGCGSSREHAPLAIKAAGVSCLIAKSFARIFFRNSFNIGLPILESAEAADGIEPGDNLEVDLAAGLIRNTTKGKEYKARPLPEFMQTLVTDGGLIGYVKRMMEEGQLKAGTDEEPPVEKAEEKKGPGARMKEIEEEAKPEGVDAPWVEEEPEEEKAAKTGDDEDDMDEDEDDEDDEDEEESEK